MKSKKITGKIIRIFTLAIIMSLLMSTIVFADVDGESTAEGQQTQIFTETEGDDEQYIENDTAKEQTANDVVEEVTAGTDSFEESEEETTGAETEEEYESEIVNFDENVEAAEEQNISDDNETADADISDKDINKNDTENETTANSTEVSSKEDATADNDDESRVNEETTEKESTDETKETKDKEAKKAELSKLDKKVKTQAGIAIKSLSLNRKSAELATNKTLKLKATILPADATEKLVWSSSDKTIASVDQNGKVTAHKYGKVTITATNEDGKIKASCTIQTRYHDVTSTKDYYFNPVYWAAEEGITRGYEDVYFGPKQTCTRRELVIFLWRLSGKPQASGTLPFSDVKYSKDTDSYKAILWGSESGIIKGYGDGTFRPDADVIRKDVLIMLYRIAGKPATTGMVRFPDVWSKEYSTKSDTYQSILWGSNFKITKGYSDNTFKPLADCLREHIVTFIYRYVHNDVADTSSSDIVIMLDPGHDSKYPSTIVGKFKEHEMNLKIANACKKELEKYKGIKVLMTRYTNDCAFPNASPYSQLRLRVEKAKNEGADLIVSLHINAAGGSQRGIMTIPQVPTKTWRADLSKVSTALGEVMRTELMKLGFQNNGVYYRYNTVNEYYPDGTLADYYGICYSATMLNLPGLIVEHGYIDNDDLKLLNTDKKLEACGIADATGIAKYFGLTKK